MSNKIFHTFTDSSNGTAVNVGCGIRKKTNQKVKKEESSRKKVKSTRKKDNFLINTKLYDDIKVQLTIYQVNNKPTQKVQINKAKQTYIKLVNKENIGKNLCTNKKRKVERK